MREKPGMATRAETQQQYERELAAAFYCRLHYKKRMARMIAWQSVELRSELNAVGLYLVALAKRAMERDV